MMKERKLRVADWGWPHDRSVEPGSAFYMKRATHVARAREMARTLDRYRHGDDTVWATEGLAFVTTDRPAATEAK